MADKVILPDNQKRVWVFMPTLDGYIFREFMIKFSILLLVSVILFLLSDVLADLSDFVENGASWELYVPYFLLKIPGNIRFILPIATLLGCMWTMATFGKNMEVTAMRASGVSLFRCGRSILLVGMLTTFVNIWFNEGLVPYTDRRAGNLLAIGSGDVKKMRVEDQKLAYRSPDKKRTWLFQLPEESDGALGVAAKDGKQYDVSVKFYRVDGSLEKDLTAKNAIYLDDKGWYFEDLSITEYSSDGLFAKPPKQLKSWLLSSRVAIETPVDMQYSVKPVEELPSWVIFDLLRRTKDMSQRSRNVYWTVFYYRLAFPWSCFLAVFLGIPLATKSERSGILTSIITAVVIIVGYIVVAQMFLVIGKQGYINSVIAGLAPTVAFIGYGIDRVVRNQA
ncbi:MAG: YjgP/YjgQ family permease [Lentisphaerae bacterium]|nr:YjgP/YjgQ family permease [Lentisphaerota bacterium]